jgi:hypothetical protein
VPAASIAVARSSEPTNLMMCAMSSWWIVLAPRASFLVVT